LGEIIKITRREEGGKVKSKKEVPGKWILKGKSVCRRESIKGGLGININKSRESGKNHNFLKGNVDTPALDRSWALDNLEFKSTGKLVRKIS
jgi:hypothetical protein